MNRFMLSLLVLVALAGCEKNIDIKLEETPPKLVVDATIENGEAPRVILTRTIGYFNQISPHLLANSFVRNADVWISNGPVIHKLKEYGVPLAPGISIYYYSTDSSNLGTAITGALNQSYGLRIIVDGKEYTSQTTIRDTTKRIDSLWWKPAPNGDTTKAVIMVRATDPPGFGDYIRYFTKANRGAYLPPFNSAFDDLFVDGTTYELQLSPGVDRNLQDPEGFLFNRGDTIQFKLSNIDRATYDFWRTMEFSYASIGNPFSTPTTIKGNISNGALGYFGGYANQFRTIILR